MADQLEHAPRDLGVGEEPAFGSFVATRALAAEGACGASCQDAWRFGRPASAGGAAGCGESADHWHRTPARRKREAHRRPAHRHRLRLKGRYRPLVAASVMSFRALLPRTERVDRQSDCHHGRQDGSQPAQLDLDDEFTFARSGCQGGATGWTACGSACDMSTPGG